MAMRESNFKYIPDKCNPPSVNMGKALIFPQSMPGLNDTVAQPFGWTEYESAFRPQYVPAPPCRKTCPNPCMPKGVGKKWPLKEYANPCASAPRSTICDLCGKTRCGCKHAAPWAQRREKVVVYDPQAVRTLYVHGELKREHPIVIPQAQLQRLLDEALNDKSHVDEENRRREEAKAQYRKQCSSFADEMRLIDEYTLKQSISPEAQEEMNEILCRSEKMIKEDSPEVRAINKVILAAKVQAIREAQLEEKKLIRCEEAQEESRINCLLEQDKGIAIVNNDEVLWNQAEERKARLRDSLRRQMEEHEACRFLQKERKEAEGACLREIWSKWEQDAKREKEDLFVKKHQIGTELLRDQDEMQFRRREQARLDKEADRQMVQYAIAKAEEQARMEQEAKELKRQKELAVKSVLDTQKRTLDARSLRDELRAKRHQEEQEREWRRREKEAVFKKRQDAIDLRQTILEQMAAREQWTADQVALDKNVYDQVFEVQDRQMELDRQKEEDRALKKAQYQLDLREQVHAFQVRKVKERKNEFIDALRQRQEWARRDKELRCVMEQKVEALKDSCLPEKYIKYIRSAVDDQLKPIWKHKVGK